MDKTAGIVSTVANSDITFPEALIIIALIGVVGAVVWKLIDSIFG